VDLAEIAEGDRVVEVGAGLGSLTLALAQTGAKVVAVELDRRLIPALQEVLGGFGNVRIERADALKADWGALLDGPAPWKMVANLPYNVAVPVILGVLDDEPRVERFVVMVQREVGERLAAGPRDPQYGAVSLRVAYHAEAKVVRRVARSVFWPQPNVDSVLVSILRRPPPVQVAKDDLWQVIRVAFQQRRKTMRGALVRLGLDADRAVEILRECGVEPSQRPEELGIEAFACIANRIGGP
jgi:16S rRNA (adenine1518-N6/adenine1519-N6)-dimethyltransferase